MAKHLTQSDIDTIIELIREWEGKLTWEKLCMKCLSEIGMKPTRQTLSSHEPISTAFQDRKRKFRTHSTTLNEGQLASQVTSARVLKLERDIQRLKLENRQLLEKFVAWQYIAYSRGIDLNKEARLP